MAVFEYKKYMCYICEERTSVNALVGISDDLFERVVEHYTLVRCIGYEDQFDEDGYVVICQKCIDEVPRPMMTERLVELQLQYDRYSTFKDKKYRKEMQDQVRLEQSIELKKMGLLVHTPRKRPWWSKLFQGGWKV